MAKIQIKSEKLTPFGGIFPIMEQFHIYSNYTILHFIKKLQFNYVKS